MFNSLELGWDLLRTLPQTMLGRIKMKTLDKCAFMASNNRLHITCSQVSVFITASTPLTTPCLSPLCGRYYGREKVESF